jgi:hypothetical protein
VEFLLNGNIIVVDSISPYGFSWTAAGDTVRLSAIATDSLGLSDTSRVVEVFVGSFIAPEVSISSPATGTSFLAGQQVHIIAEASDTDGSITKVEFFADGSSIGEDDSAPFEVYWTPIPGSFELQAVAMDDDSLEAISVTVPISVTLESAIHSMRGAEMMMVYPNPASGSICIEFTGLQKNEDYQLEAIGLNGALFVKRTFSTPDGTYSQTLDISAFPQGAYHIRLTDNDGNFLFRKLIKN